MLPWETASRDGVYGATRRRQDSTADSGSSSSDVSAAVAVAVAVGERARRLPQQSTLDGGLRGAPPPLRRLSAVEPRHLAPLGSPPHSPRPLRPAAAAAAPAAPPHPTPTISVSSAPDDDSPGAPGSPEGRRSLAHSDEPSSVFASADATPTEPGEPPLDRGAPVLDRTVSSSSCDDVRTDVPKVEVRVRSVDEPSPACAARESRVDSAAPAVARTDSQESDRPRSSEDHVSVRRTLSREPSTIKEISPASSKDSSKIGDLPGNVSERASVSGESQSNPELSETGPPPAAAEATAAPSCAEPGSSSRAPVAPLAVIEDIGADDENSDRVPSAAPMRRVSGDSKEASESDAVKKIAHKDEQSSVSESNIVKRKSELAERQQRNDVCPWEDE